MSVPWELLGSHHRGHAGRLPIVAKTFRLPDGSTAEFEIVGDAGTRAVACVALTDGRIRISMTASSYRCAR